MLLLSRSALWRVLLSVGKISSSDNRGLRSSEGFARDFIQVLAFSVEALTVFLMKLENLASPAAPGSELEASGST